MEVNAKSLSRSHYPLSIPLIECVPVAAEQRRRERGHLTERRSSSGRVKGCGSRLNLSSAAAFEMK